MEFIIADDSPFYRLHFKHQLHSLGHTVLAEAAHGKELVKLTKRFKPEFILTDMEMRPVNGLNASFEIHRVFPEIKIICSTHYSYTDWISDMQMAGINGYVFKNSGTESLAKAIMCALKNEFYTDIYVLKELISQLKKIFEQSEQSELVHEIRKIINDAIRIKNINGYKPTSREVFILSESVKGKPVKQIASELQMTERNISKIKVHLRDKFEVTTNPELLKRAFESGII